MGAGCDGVLACSCTFRSKICELDVERRGGEFGSGARIGEVLGLSERMGECGATLLGVGLSAGGEFSGATALSWGSRGAFSLAAFGGEVFSFVFVIVVRGVLSCSGLGSFFFLPKPKKDRLGGDAAVSILAY